MTNEQLAVLLMTFHRECNLSITEVDVSLQRLGNLGQIEIEALLDPVQVFSDRLKARAQMLAPKVGIS